MQINENYKIESDTLNVTLYRKQKPRKVGIPAGWEAIGYFSTPQNALSHLVNLEVMETGLKDFRAVVEKQKELSALIKALEGLPELVQSAPRPAKDKTGGKHGAQAVLV